MNQKKDTIREDEIDLREIFIIFIKRKWWFIGSILVVLIIGLLYVILSPANYLLTYQIEIKENYSNKNLSELYPNYEENVNYMSLENVPVIFKSENVFKSLDGITEDIDYNKLLQSESINISLNKNTSIFNISVSDPDYNLADKIAITLIDELNNFIKNGEKIIFNEILEKIELDIEDLENKNGNYENIIVDLEKNLNKLYVELNKYIVDYNISLHNELEESRNSENTSFYDVIIPPNDISYKISVLQKEVDFNRGKVLENKSKIIDLDNLNASLLKDEDAILNRVNIVSEDPFYEVESSKLRNIAIVLVLSIIIGIMITIIVNFLLNLKTKRD